MLGNPRRPQTCAFRRRAVGALIALVSLAGALAACARPGPRTCPTSGALERKAPKPIASLSSRPLRLTATVAVMDSDTVEMPELTTTLFVTVAAADSGDLPDSLVADSVWVACGPEVFGKPLGFLNSADSDARRELRGGVSIPDWGVKELDVVLRLRGRGGQSAVLGTRSSPLR